MYKVYLSSYENGRVTIVVQKDKYPRYYGLELSRSRRLFKMNGKSPANIVFHRSVINDCQECKSKCAVALRKLHRMFLLQLKNREEGEILYHLRQFLSSEPSAQSLLKSQTWPSWRHLPSLTQPNWLLWQLLGYAVVTGLTVEPTAGSDPPYNWQLGFMAMLRSSMAMSPL